ncbi:uncharacterized protein FTJAE_14033 [Fusarium tjaetaba]|uniref:Uncharacterized protein n=1 Tax=Fusarium tjaetaba TaxID=1567544 RepID=A0A8H5QCJ1_9HYPO|nr:uncharacterized protein FTJAE_14033 [Fusarium tjaetaba]KAF5612744.1 hypothetical protein FTJAE_14033 [Fusarium tjaetaba]
MESIVGFKAPLAYDMHAKDTAFLPTDTIRILDTTYPTRAMTWLEAVWLTALARPAALEEKPTAKSSLQNEIPALPSGFDERKVLEIRLSGSEPTITGHILETIKCLSTPMSSKLAWGTFSEIATLPWEGGNLLTKQGEQAVESMLHTLSCGSLSAKPPTEERV